MHACSTHTHTHTSHINIHSSPPPPTPEPSHHLRHPPTAIPSYLFTPTRYTPQCTPHTPFPTPPTHHVAPPPPYTHAPSLSVRFSSAITSLQPTSMERSSKCSSRYFLGSYLGARRQAMRTRAQGSGLRDQGSGVRDHHGVSSGDTMGARRPSGPGLREQGSGVREGG